MATRREGGGGVVKNPYFLMTPFTDLNFTPSEPGNEVKEKRVNGIWREGYKSAAVRSAGCSGGGGGGGGSVRDLTVSFWRLRRRPVGRGGRGRHLTRYLTTDRSGGSTNLDVNNIKVYLAVY